jgi:serine/threonine protein kinase
MSVFQDEAKNQAAAYNLLCPKICDVPKVYRSFEYNKKGYILMEYVSGDSPNDMTGEQVSKVNELLNQFSRITGKPGALYKGAVSRKGRFWPDFYDVYPQDAAGLEFWLNSVLKTTIPVSLKDFTFSLCHLDLVPRNIIWRSTGELCLVDWPSAGFYPRTFEWAALSLGMMEEIPFTTALLTLQDMEAYRKQVLLLLEASGRAAISDSPY